MLQTQALNKTRVNIQDGGLQQLQQEPRLQLAPQRTFVDLATPASHWCQRNVWNVFLRTFLHNSPQLAPDLQSYHNKMCMFSQKIKDSAWLMYDTAFRYMAASKLSIAWDNVNEQSYHNIYKKETPPYCIHCHTYSHRVRA